MKRNNNRKAPEKILGIEASHKMLQRLEDLEDLRTLKAMRKKPLNFKKLEDFLEEHQQSL